MAQLRNRSQPSWASRPSSDPLTIRELSGLDVCSQAAIKVIPGIIAPDGNDLAEGRDQPHQFSLGYSHHDASLRGRALPNPISPMETATGAAPATAWYLRPLPQRLWLQALQSRSDCEFIRRPRPRGASVAFKAESRLTNARCKSCIGLRRSRRIATHERDWNIHRGSVLDAHQLATQKKTRDGPLAEPWLEARARATSQSTPGSFAEAASASPTVSPRAIRLNSSNSSSVSSCRSTRSCAARLPDRPFAKRADLAAGHF